MKYLTRAQAMEYLHIKNSKMWQLTTDREIPFYQDGPNGRMLFDIADLDKYMESKKVVARKVNPCATYRKRRVGA